MRRRSALLLSLLAFALLVPAFAWSQQTSDSSVTPTSDPTPAIKPPLARGEYLAQKALALVGCRYHWGGAAADTGFDCSGLVQAVCRQCGLRMPRLVHDQFKMGTPVEYEQLQPGDLVFFQNTYRQGVSHVGIYIGDNRFVNAGDENSGVMISEIGPNNRAHWAGGRRLDLSKIRPIPGEIASGRRASRQQNRRLAALSRSLQSSARGMRTVRVCVDSGDLATPWCDATRPLRVTASQAAHMRRCRLHHAPPGESR